PSDGEAASLVAGQSCNLMELICDAEVPSQAPICKECSDELLVGMDQQLKLLEDDCATYRQLIDMLKDKYSNADVASLKQTLRNLQDEERALKAQYDQLVAEESRLDAELVEKKAQLEEKTEEEASRWRQFRDNHSVTGEEVKYPLYASGSWKPFGNNNMDSGIMAYLQCFEELRAALQASNSVKSGLLAAK
ncbi:hypothetical protein OESDEN_13807, partial [Oesophagostomum dentatum]